MIFTTKSLIYTCATGIVGVLFYYIFGVIFNIKWLGIVLAILFASIGFAIGTFKIPDSNGTELTRKLGGESIDKALIRWWKFRKKGNVIYTYIGTEEEKING